MPATKKKKTKTTKPTDPDKDPRLSLRDVHLAGKYAVLKNADIPIERRIVHCEGGFGCNAKALGTAVFGLDVSTNKKYRWDRYDFARLATPKEVEASKAFYKRNGFEPVCKKLLRGYKPLIGKQGFGKAMVVARHKKSGMYRLVVVANDGADKWWLAPVAGNPADEPVPDKLLERMNDWMNS